MNSLIRRQYIRSSALSVVSKGVMAISAVFVLYALNRILEKHEFGLFMLALSACLLAAICISGGFRSLIMYYVSREHAKPVTGISLAWGGSISILFMLLLIILANPIAVFMEKPELEIWLANLAPLIPAYTLNIILTSHYRADKEVITMLVFQEILPAALKMIFLLIIWTAKLPVLWIADGFILCFLLPFIFLYIWKPIRLHFGLKDLNSWDIRYGLNISINQMMSKSISNLMMLLIGYFADSHAVADFAMAMRVSQILLIPKMIFAQLHVPRIGTRLAKDDKNAMMQEYDVIRQAGLLMTLFGCLGIVIAGQFVLSFFGDYKQAFPLLLLLSAASLIRAGFGDAGDFLALTGRSVPILLSNVISLASILICFVIFVPLLGNYGIGMAVFAGALTNMISIAVSLGRHEKVYVLTPLATAIMASGAGALFFLAAQLGL